MPDKTETKPAAERTGEPTAATAGDTELVEEDLVIEEISIDGMCGVY